MMDQEVLTDPAVAGECNGGFIYLKVNAARGEGPGLVEKHAVEGFPTFVFLGPDGAEVDRQVGYVAKDEFLPLLKDVRAGNTLAALPGKIEKAPEDGALRAAYGKALLRRDRAPEAREHLEKAVALDPREANPSTAESLLALAFLRAMEEHSAAPVRAFLEKHPDGPLAVRAHRALVMNLLQDGDTKGAMASMDFLEGKGALEGQQRCHYAFLLATERKDGAKALAIADDERKKAPEAIHPPMARAFALSALGRHDEAVEQARKALEKAPEDAKGEGEGFLKRLEQARDEAKE